MSEVWTLVPPPLSMPRCKKTSRGASLERKRTPLGPYLRPMPKVVGGSLWGGRFLMGEVPKYMGTSLMRQGIPLGSYGEPMPRALR